MSGPAGSGGTGRCHLNGMTDASFNTEAAIRLLPESGIGGRHARAIMEAVRVTLGRRVAGMLAAIRNDVLWIKRIWRDRRVGDGHDGFLYTEIGSVQEEPLPRDG